MFVCLSVFRRRIFFFTVKLFFRYVLRSIEAQICFPMFQDFNNKMPTHRHVRPNNRQTQVPDRISLRLLSWRFWLVHFPYSSYLVCFCQSMMINEMSAVSSPPLCCLFDGFNDDQPRFDSKHKCVRGCDSLSHWCSK